MSRILFAATPLTGHVNPLIPIAQRLVDDGHEVFFQTSDIFSTRIEAAGSRFLPLLGNANYDYLQLGEIIPELRSPDNAVKSLAFWKQLFGDRIPQQYLGLQQAVRDKKIDLVLTDVLFFGMMPLLLSGEPRPPLISFGVIAPIWSGPSGAIVARPDDASGGEQRTKAANERFWSGHIPGLRHMDALLRQLGAPKPGGLPINDVYRLPDQFLQLGAEAFEYPMEDCPQNLTFVGPVLPAASAPKQMPAWIEELDPSLPLVLVTQGTLANFDFDELINPALAGLANEPVQVVVTAGGGKEGKIKVTANAIVRPYIPYEQILPRTSIFITNGGYNGVQQALTYGVPIVTCGVSADKPFVASRIAWNRVGVVIDGASATPEQVRGSVRTILGNPAYTRQAQTLGKEIAKTNALGTISRIVKEAIAASPMSRT